MDKKKETITYNITWEEFEEQREANKRKEEYKNRKLKIKKYV